MANRLVTNVTSSPSTNEIPTASSVQVGQEHRLELADLSRHVLHHRRGQAGRPQHHHQAVTPKRTAAEDINVPVLQVKQVEFPHPGYRSCPPPPRHPSTHPWLPKVR